MTLTQTQLQQMVQVGSTNLQVPAWMIYLAAYQSARRSIARENSRLTLKRGLTISNN